MRRVIEQGYADPKYIGLNGHNYGREGTASIGFFDFLTLPTMITTTITAAMFVEGVVFEVEAR